MAELSAATRGSALARWQADHVAALVARTTGTVVRPLVVETSGDRRLDVPIWAIGGKGAFVKEVQAAVLDGRARLAVHSAKDLPAVTPPGLVVAAFPERADPRDVLVGGTLASLPTGAVVATGSVRRRAQLSWLRPDLTFTELRGNIATRLERRPPGGAMVVAAAALHRLDLLDSLGAEHELVPADVVVPQVGQGALAVECRIDDAEARAALAAIDHLPTRRAVEAERAFLAELGGDCDLPAGALATLDGAEVHLDAVLASLDGHIVLRRAASGVDGPALGAELARFLLRSGGQALL